MRKLIRNLYPLFQVFLLFFIPVKSNAQLIYSTNRNSASSTVISVPTNTVVTTIPLNDRPYGVAVSRINNKVYIGHFGANNISVIDPCSNTVVNTINGAGTSVTGIAVSPDGQRLYACSYGSNIIKVYNAVTYAFITNITVGTLSVTAPVGIIVSPDNARVYVSLFDEDKIAVINAVTNTVLTYYNTDLRPLGLDISNDGTKLYASCQNTNTLIVFNTGTGARIATIVLGPVITEGAKGVTLNHANTACYVAMHDVGTLKVVNTITNTLTATIPTGALPVGVDISPDDSKVYVSCIGANRMDVINTATNTNITNIPIGQLPYSFGKFVFPRNIDSVRFNYTYAGCRSFSFQGLGYIFGGVPASSYQWSFGDGNTASTQNPGHTYSADGTFLVKLVITDAFGCKDSITRSVNTLQTMIDAGADTTVCSGVPFSLHAWGTSLSGWSWTPAGVLNNPNAQNPVATITTRTKFYVTATHSAGCTYIDSVTVDVKPLPNINTIPDTAICQFTTVQLTTTGGTSYSWSPATGLDNPNSPNPTAGPLVPIKYYVTGTGANGCTNIDSVTVTLKPAPAVNTIPDTTICGSTSVQLTTTGTAASYAWTPTTGLSNPNISNPVATPSAPTKYYVTGTGANGCTNIDSVMVTPRPLPNVNTIPDTSICNQSAVQLTTTGAVSYTWTPSAGLSNPNIGNPVATPLIATKYYVTGTDANGCTNIDSVTVTLKPLPVINTIPDTAICQGTGVQLTTTGGASYTWTPTTGLNNPNIGSPVATPLVPTKYYVTGTAANGCTNIDSVTVTLKALPSVNTTPDTSFCGASGNIQMNTTGSATSFSWTPVTGLSNPNIGNPVATPTATIKYYVTGTGANGCTNTDSVLVTQKTLPAINTIPDTLVCPGSSVQLTTTGGVSYTWTPATGLSNPNIASPVATPLVPTKYYVTGTGANGCTHTDSVMVGIGTILNVSTTPDTSVCAQSSIQLQTTGATSYSWTPTTGLSNPNIANPVVTPSVTTKYYVSGTNGTGCAGTDSVTVTINPPPQIVTTPDTLLCGSGSVQLNTTGGTGYFWFPAFGLNNPTIANPIATPGATTQYIVTGYDANGCSASDTVNIRIGFSAKSGLLLPSAFSPNGDGVNDCFGIRFYEGITELEFRIFNRWGENVFYTTDPTACWNGRFRGKINPGNYVYYLKAKTACTEPVFIKGSVILMR